MTNPLLQHLTQEELKRNLQYNLETGIFTWIAKKRGGVKIGDVAGCASSVGYILIGLHGALYLAHRLAFLYMEGSFPEGQVDHINHNTGDNQFTNLRTVSNRENAINRSRSSKNTSGFTGVCWCKTLSKWHAQIMVKGRGIHLGYFVNMQDAIEARKEANIKYGFHRNHGGDKHDNI